MIKLYWPNAETVDKIRNDVIDAYNNGKLSDEHYTNLKNEISNIYQETFKNRIEIESVTGPKTEAVNKIRSDIEDAYSDRKITELDYNLLNGKISRMLDKKWDVNKIFLYLQSDCTFYLVITIETIL